MLIVLWQTKSAVSFLLKIEMGSGGGRGGKSASLLVWSAASRGPLSVDNFPSSSSPNPESVRHCRNVKMLPKNVRSHLYANDKLVEP